MRVGPQKGVEVKCIHKHEEGTKGHDGSGGRGREIKTYKEYERGSYQIGRNWKKLSR
jgi:hypothetical protein